MESNDITVRYIEFFANEFGMYMDDANRLDLEFSTFNANTEYGLYGHHAEEMNVMNCSFTNNKFGFYVAHGEDSVLKNNTFNNNIYNFGNWGSKTSDFEWDIDTSNTINGKPIYYIVGASNLIFDETMDIGYLALISCDNITVRNVSITHNYNGIALIDTTNSTVTNCSISYCHYGISLVLSENNVIDNCKSYNNSHGIFLYKASSNTVQNCQSFNNRFGIWLHFCPLPANTLRNNDAWNNDRNYVMRGSGIDDFRQDIDTSNTADGKAVYLIMDTDGITMDGMAVGWLVLVNCTNAVIRNMEFSHTDQALLLVGTTNSIISNCIAHDSDRGFAFYFDSNNNVLENCHSYNNGYGVYFYSSSDSNVIQNCIIENNSLGIYAYKYATNHEIRNCLFHNNSEGILLYYHSDDNLIYNCTFSANGYGVDLYYKNSGNQIINSTFVDNEIALDIYYYDSDTTVDNCNFTHNSIFAIRCYKSTDNLIINNHFLNNYYAMLLYTSSTGNQIYRNYFINSAIYKHVRDDCGNEWDNGYPYGGNYWDDYTGADNYKGAAQDEPGSDGIGDTPYIILNSCGEPSAQDNYPIINPPPRSWIEADNIFGEYISSSTTVTIKGEDDEISGNTYYIHYIINNGPENVGAANQDITLRFSVGVFNIEYWAVDALGNEESPHHYRTLIVDNRAPSTRIVFTPSANLTNGYYYISPNTNISFDATDIGAGVAYTYYSINGIGALYTGPFSLQPGNYTIMYRSMDFVNNYEGAKIAKVIVSYDLAPTTICQLDPEPNENGWIAGEVTISFKAMDKDGVKATYYRVDGSKWKIYNEPFVINEEGKHVIEFYSEDNIGLKETVNKIVLQVDDTIPIINVRKPSNALYLYDREIMPLSKTIIIGKLTIEAEIDDSCSGVEKTILKIDGEQKDISINELKYTWNEFAIGKHEITIESYDKAGNKATKAIDIWILNLNI